MKTKNILLIAFAILLTGFVACKKSDPTPDNGTNPPTAGADSNYLSVIFNIEVNGSVRDTVESLIYSYDASKRVTQLKDSVWNPTVDYKSETTVYFYHNSDTLPYKSTLTTVYVLPQPNQIINSFYFYDAAGLRIKDSVIAPTRHYVAVQQYAANKITSSRVDSIFSAPSYSFYYAEARKDTAILDVNGNVTSNISHRGIAYVFSSTVTYDTHPSPFIKLSNAKTFALFPTGETLIMEMPQKYNRLKILEKSSFQGQPYIVQYDDDLTGKYTYKANGYPLTITETDISSGETDIAAFKYKAL